jgi:hypothetical protein
MIKNNQIIILNLINKTQKKKKVLLEIHTKGSMDNGVGLAFCVRYEEEGEEEDDDEDDDGKLEAPIATPLPSIIAISIFLERREIYDAYFHRIFFSFFFLCISFLFNHKFFFPYLFLNIFNYLKGERKLL